VASLLREPGLFVSGVAHVALLTAGLVGFATVAPFPDADEGIPVEFITENQFSQITRGEETAPEVVETPAPRVEREAEIRNVRPPGDARNDAPSPPTRTAEMPVDDTPVEAAEAPPPPAAAPPPPPPEPQPAPVETAQPAPPAPVQEIAEVVEEPEPSVAESAPLPPARTDRARAQQAFAARAAQERAEQARVAEAKRIADAKAAEARRIADAKAAEERARETAANQERAKREADAKRLAEAKAREEQQARARREAETTERFNPGDIAALLRSTEEPRSQGASGQEINRTASLGTATGSAARLDPSQRDALIGLIQGQLRRCWDAPIAAQSASNPPVASIRFALNADGSLAGQPQVVNDSSDPLFRAVADSATRATRRCAPLQIPAQFAPYYEDWKNMTVNFNPLDT
jgi:colicin import membrane protein